MSPWRYSVFRQPRSPGSNGRRAIPMMRSTSDASSRALSAAMPISPVGPVTATVRPTEPPFHPPKSCSLVVEHLTQHVPHLHQVVLVGHHLIDVLVRRWVLIKQSHGLVSVPRPPSHLLSQRLDSELLARLT